MQERAPALIAECERLIAQAVAYLQEHLEYLERLEDMPEISGWGVDRRLMGQLMGWKVAHERH